MAMRRVVRPELLDSDSGSDAEVRASLADLRRINRWFGGTSTTRSLLKRVSERTGRRELSALDVGSGPGESVLGAAKDLAGCGIAVLPTLLDRTASHLPRNGNPVLVADAMALPFRDDSFDAVSCSLLIHHLKPAEVVRFTNEALRVSRVAVLVNDLSRSAPHLALVYMGMPLFRSRLTRHDSVASVRRAYTPEELYDLLQTSRAAEIEIGQHYLFRMGAIAWKEPSA